MTERRCDVLVAGGGLGGVAAALAATARGLDVVMSEPTDWIGGQLTSQAVPPDEHRWIERHGCTATYRKLRDDIDGSALAAQPGKSQGRPLKSPGSKPIAQNGLPILRSPKGPCPSRPNLSPAPDDPGAFKQQFHAASSSGCARARL
jgi:hypothetical protein